jgi:hypothetical protein
MAPVMLVASNSSGNDWRRYRWRQYGRPLSGH